MSRARRLPDVLSARAKTSPTVIAHDDTTRRLSFEQWDQECTELAGGLNSAGVGVGDRVLLPITNAHAVGMAIAYVAVQRAGAISVPLSPRLSADETRYFAELTGARWAITDVAEKMPELDGVRIWPISDPPSDAAALIDQSLLASASDADIISTSGTTGRPKGVVFTHADLLDRIGDGTATSSSRVLLHALPFTGFGGCHGMMLSPLHFGSTLITQPAFDAAGMVTLVRDKRPDTMHLVPSMLRLILDLPEIGSADLSSVHWIITGTAPVPADSVQRVIELWPHIRVINTYGMTESSVSVSTRSRASVLKPGSVGRPENPQALEIRDDEGNVLADGEDGEIWTRAGQPRRYWRDDTTTQSTWRDGWLKTGDVGHIDPDGDLILTGRSKDLIIRGGYNIGPGEVENVLLAHPAVADAAVVGVPHPVLGEDIAAAVVLRPGAGATSAELVEWSRDRLADNKVPRTIVFKDALPYNQNLKVVKRDLVGELTVAAQADRVARRAQTA